MARSGDANPKTEDGRHIRLGWSGSGCFVYLDFAPLKPGETRVPGTAPPEKAVPCPDELTKPAYQACRGGTISYQGASCQCHIPGNPPRVSDSPCP